MQDTFDSRADAMSQTRPGEGLNDAERRGAKDLKRALIFGIVAATLQMGVLLWFLYG